MIGKTGAWDDETLENHRYDKTLSQALVDFFKKNEAKSVVDLGCGHGNYTKHFNDEGIKCDGFDGNPNTEKLTNGLCKVLDLSEEAKLPEKYEWVMSLEVGEHLPKEFELQFLANLHALNTKGVIVSWAIPGQGGHGHFNEQPNAYIKDLFHKWGYINDIEAEQELRTRSEFFWFRNTIMVFKRP